MKEKFVSSTSPINRIVTHAYRRNEFYRNKMRHAGVTPDTIHSEADLKRIPFTYREELQGGPWKLAAAPLDRLVQAHLSTGTSGKPPHYIVYDWEDIYARGLMPLIAEAPNEKIMCIAAGEMVFNALPYEVSVTGLAIHRAIQDGLGACVVPLGKGGFYSSPEKSLRLMKKIGGDHLFTTPTYALHLAEVAQKNGIAVDTDIALRSLWLVGERCSSAMRTRLESHWSCPVRLYYGSLESGPIGVECSLQECYHVASNFVSIQVEPMDNLPDSLRHIGAGEIVITTLWRYGSPLLRYRTGDIGMLMPRACACGIPGSILNVFGRREDLICCDGKCILLGDVENLLLCIPDISPWFRLMVNNERMTVLLPFDDEPATLYEKVKLCLLKELNIKADVKFIKIPHPTGGKFVRLVKKEDGV